MVILKIFQNFKQISAQSYQDDDVELTYEKGKTWQDQEPINNIFKISFM
jgi:hypothetical protein